MGWRTVMRVCGDLDILVVWVGGSVRVHSSTIMWYYYHGAMVAIMHEEGEKKWNKKKRKGKKGCVNNHRSGWLLRTSSVFRDKSLATIFRDQLILCGKYVQMTHSPV